MTKSSFWGALFFDKVNRKASYPLKRQGRLQVEQVQVQVQGISFGHVNGLIPISFLNMDAKKAVGNMSLDLSVEVQAGYINLRAYEQYLKSCDQVRLPREYLYIEKKKGLEYDL